MKYKDHDFGPSIPLCQHCFGTGHEIDTASLGQTLRERRERCGLGAREMSRLTGIPLCTLVYLEQGKLAWKLAQLDAVVDQCARKEKALQ